MKGWLILMQLVISELYLYIFKATIAFSNANFIFFGTIFVVMSEL